jgi:hypothetical protein
MKINLCRMIAAVPNDAQIVHDRGTWMTTSPLKGSVPDVQLSTSFFQRGFFLRPCPFTSLRVLPRDAIELGCGTAYISAWLSRRSPRRRDRPNHDCKRSLARSIALLSSWTAWAYSEPRNVTG